MTVAIAICSWIAISNHCAFNAVATSSPSIDNECPFHSKPAKKKGNRQRSNAAKFCVPWFRSCCKSWTRDDARVSDVDLSVEQSVVFPASRNLAPLLLDTGPPEKLHSLN